jgi:Tetratricopeptide repeat
VLASATDFVSLGFGGADHGLRVLPIQRDLAPADPATRASLKNLAGLLQDQGELVAARLLYERALAITENMLGPEHPDTNRLRAALLRARRRGDEGQRPS